MESFKMKVAGAVAEVQPQFGSTMEYFRPYLTEEPSEFSITVTEADRVFEQEDALREAQEEGMKPRTFAEPFLERAAIQRKFAEFLLDRDTLLFHGSTVAVDGFAYLFTAKCGTGKSTHTRLWRQVFPEARMVNDDKPFLEIRNDCVIAHGSPWSGKHGLSSNISVPLKGICILERGPENKIRPISPDDAMEMLLAQGYCPPDRKEKFLELTHSLANTVPLWSMECTKDPEAAKISYQAMKKAPLVRGAGKNLFDF